MAAAGLDSIGAIVGFAICSGIAIPSGSIVYSILSGPLQVPPSPFPAKHAADYVALC